MLDMFFGVFSGLWTLFKYPIYLILIGMGIFLVLVIINIIIELLKGKRFKKGKHKRVKKKSIFRRIFIDCPHQFVLDLLKKDPDFFKYQGVIIFEGRQGAGKTISMIEYAMRMQEEYPLAKCCSNLGYIHEDIN